MMAIPAIDLMDGRCVRLRRGAREDSKTYSGDPAAIAGEFVHAGAERIHIVDLDGAFEGEGRNLDTIQRIASVAKDAGKVEIEVGGGLRTRSAVARLLDLGADYAVIGTIAVERPDLAAEIMTEFEGRIYIGLDLSGGRVATRGWREKAEISAGDILRFAEASGARGLVVTAIERDGMLEGPDMDRLISIADKTDLPIIASGGVSSAHDIRALAGTRLFEGAIIGKALYEGRLTIAGAIEAAAGEDDPAESGD